MELSAMHAAMLDAPGAGHLEIKPGRESSEERPVSLDLFKSLEKIASIFIFLSLNASFFAWSLHFLLSLPGFWPINIRFTFSSVSPRLTTMVFIVTVLTSPTLL